MSKYLPEIKIKACEDYLSGKYSHREVCEKYGIYFSESRRSSMIDEWLPSYSLYGAAEHSTEGFDWGDKVTTL